MVYFNPNNMRTLQKRYLLKDEFGQVIETPERMLQRVADAVCKNNEELKSKILEMMDDLRFLPNTPTLMNAGTTNMLSACFVIDCEDNLESIIHDAGWWQAQIHKLGGGVGINFGKLRPKGDLIKKTGGITSGVLGFLEVFNILSEIIRQGGKRDGANMALLPIDHPEIIDWINAKTGVNKGKFRNFNLSVLITDKFMHAVEENLDWNLEFNGKIYKTIKAKYLYDITCKSAWECGCPGMIFVDEINRNNPVADIMKIECTNPCGEIPAYIGCYKGEKIAESCNLGSLNLSKYVYTEAMNKRLFDFLKFEEDIKNATEFLDMVIDANIYPFEFISKGTLLTRKIGLGITGLSECLIKLSLIYGSKESLEFIEKVMSSLQDISHIKSEELGELKGYYSLFNELSWDRIESLPKRRNLATTCIAPTGSIGRFVLGHPYSSGIEPPPAINMYSYIVDGKIDDGIHPLLLEMLKENFKMEDKNKLNLILEKIKQDGKSIQNIKEIPEHIRKLFLVAEEIPYETHIKVQSTIQKYVDNAVSKTINMRNDVSVEDLSKAFMLAWKSKCKGITIYRDNSKDKQVFEVHGKVKEEIITREEIKYIDDLKKRDDILPGLTFVKRTGCSTLFTTLTKTWNEDGALELFINKSTEKGGCLGLQDGLAITISVYNRYLESIGHQHAINAMKLVTEHLLRKTCRSSEIAIEKQKQKIEKGEHVKRTIDSLSCPNAIAQCLKYMLEHDVSVMIDKENTEIIDTLIKDTIILKKEDNENNLKKCPECGNKTIRQEGCMNDSCIVCGWGGCS